MARYEIVAYRDELEPGIIELRNLTWHSDPSVPRRFLDWKYRRNPYFERPMITVALHGGRVVGMRGAYGTCWEAEGAARVIIPAADDFAILPAHRNAGLATLIMHSMLEGLAARGFAYVVALSAGRMTTLASLATGWKSAGAMEPVARFGLGRRIAHAFEERLHGTRVLWRLAPRDVPAAYSSEGPFARLDALGRTPGRESGTTLVFERAVRAQAMAALIERIGHDGRIRQVRDAEFLAWRYQKPAREYGFLYLERSDGRLDGFLALGRFPAYQPPMLAFHVIDMEGTTPAVREELLATALRHGRFPAIGAWSAGVSAEDRPLLDRAGFVPVDIASRARGLPCVLVRAVGSTAASEWRIGRRHLADPRDWDMRLLYSMHG
jgi:GNAT superfamily N-acetyltransferase